MLTFDSNIVTENVWMSLTRVNLNMKQIYSCYYAIRQQEIFFSCNFCYFDFFTWYGTILGDTVQGLQPIRCWSCVGSKKFTDNEKKEKARLLKKIHRDQDLYRLWFSNFSKQRRNSVSRLLVSLLWVGLRPISIRKWRFKNKCRITT